MLDGIVVKAIKRNVDERGSFSEIMRLDWKELIGKDEIVQTNFAITYPGIVRAWHRHEKGQIDYFVVLRGALKICAFDEETNELDEIISTGENLQVVRIPGHYWHGYKVVGDELSIIVYFVNKLYDYNNPDEIRRPWNYQIKPLLINEKSDDSRVGKLWDWLAFPFK